MTDVRLSLSPLHSIQTFGTRTRTERELKFIVSKLVAIRHHASLSFTPSVSVCLYVVTFSHSVGIIHFEMPKETGHIAATNNRHTAQFIHQ